MKEKFSILNKISFLTFFTYIFLFVSCSENAETPSPVPIVEFTQIDFEPSWSESAEMITYAHSNIDPDFTGIYIINSNGTGKQQIISDFARCPDFSPGGDRIAFTQFENIYKIKTNGDSIVQLTSAGKNYFPKWSADNALIAFSNSINSDEYDIWTMNTDGSQKTLIDSNANYPDWVNGSSSLIYFKPMKNSDGSQTGDTLVQYFLSSNTKQIMAILTGDEHKINMYPSFAGDKIIFCSFNSESTAYVYSMDSDGSNITKLTTTQSYSPDYSPVNEKIVYTNRDKGNGRLWIMDKNGSGKTQLTE